MTTKKEDPAARLTLPLPGPNQSTALVNVVLQQVATVQGNPDLANHPEVATSANNVKAQATALGVTLNNLGMAHATVTTLGAQRDQEGITLRRLHTNLEALLNLAAAGDKKAALAWGGKIVSRTVSTASTDAPLNALAKALKTPGSVEAKCKAEKGVICYLFQMGTDPAHPETWPAPKIVGGSKYTVSGLTTGQKVYFRIAIVRRGDVQGQWSDVLEVTVR